MEKIRFNCLLSKFLGMTVINVLFLLFIRFKGIDTIAFSTYIFMIFSWCFLVEFKYRQLENWLRHLGMKNLVISLYGNGKIIFVDRDEFYIRIPNRL